jgi:hypothetical protein
MKVRWGRVAFGLFVVAFGCALIGVLLAPQLSRQLADSGDTPPAATAAGYDRPASDGRATSTARSAVPTRAQAGDLKPFRVLTLQYTPYMATLAHMAASGSMERYGYTLELVDVYAEDVDLDEEGQCEAVRSGSYDALATTLDAVRKCGPGVAVGVPIGQSAGNDAIVAKAGIETWQGIFDHAIAFTGGSVSEYMACFASHTANAPIRVPVPSDDAAAAVDDWINSGVEQDIASVVAWEPEVERALAAVEGSHVILSSKDVRILWDVVEFSRLRVDADPAAFEAFTRAYYASLLDLSSNPDAALDRILAWSDGDDARQALLTTEEAATFRADLDREAFATLRDAAQLMEEKATLRNRLEESAFYWRYCGAAVPDVPDLDTLIADTFVLAARAEPALVGSASERPSAEVFQVTDYTNREAVSDDQIASARLIFETGVEIEFLPNRTDFRDAAAALGTLEDAVRFLRTCADCVLEVQGSSALPGAALARNQASQTDADALAVARGRKVHETLIQQFDVPAAQLRFIETAHARRFAGSTNEQELRQDRRTYLTGYQLTGGL